MHVITNLLYKSVSFVVRDLFIQWLLDTKPENNDLFKNLEIFFKNLLFSISGCTVKALKGHSNAFKCIQ